MLHKIIEVHPQTSWYGTPHILNRPFKIAGRSPGIFGPGWEQFWFTDPVTDEEFFCCGGKLEPCRES